MRSITEVISTKRSAHHAFITWFCQNARRPIVFFNNALPSSPPRLREVERFHIDIAPRMDRVDELVEGQNDVLLNFEGKIPSSIEKWNRKYLQPRLKGRLVRVVFLRDPVNTLASLAKRCRPSDFRSLFKYFYQVLALEEILGRLAQKDSNFCEKVVLMAPWLTNDLYRAEVAAYFQLTPGAPPVRVTRQGGGSSFHGMDYEPSDNPAALAERWRAVEDNPLFLAPFAENRTVETLRSYFRLFGAHESLDPATIDVLAGRAAAEPAAADYLRRILIPMRRARATLGAMEFAPQPAVRELWKGVLTTRMMLKI